MQSFPATPTSTSTLIDQTKHRCNSAAAQIQSLPPTKLTDSCKLTLLRSITSELNFLTRLSTSPPPTATPSFNIGYIESLLHILHHPRISKASRLCKPSNGVHVDIVCTLDKAPAWFIVSDRNPNFVSWVGSRRGDKGLKLRVERVLDAARASIRLKPASVLLFFANGVDEAVAGRLVEEFGAVEVGGFGFLDVGFSEGFDGDWVGVSARDYVKARAFRINVENSVGCKLGNGVRGLVVERRVEMFGDLGEKFCALVSSMRCVGSSVKPEDLVGEDVVNFDTTALIAIVSGISNGGTGRLLATPESELKERFKGNYEFVIAQVMSEVEKPILEELICLVSGKIGMICESVHLEFRELVSMCGGPNEKMRAEQLLKCLLIVPDSPSARMMDILTTRKIALKNKLVFGTGDQWLAPTLTANMGFVRAISQTGMSLLTLEHRPRALTGD